MDKHAWNLGGVLAKCDEIGGQAAQGVGYGMAYVFSRGMVQVRVVGVVLVCVCVGGYLLLSAVSACVIRSL
jgi:hypothetical protein